MTLPEPQLPKRRPQIFDDETWDQLPLMARDERGGWQQAAMWTRHFIARLATLVRKIGGNN